MKRPMAVGAMVGILLAASTAAFATPVEWTSYATGLPFTEDWHDDITFFVPYTPYDAAHPGSSMNDPILIDPGYEPTLTIESSDVDPLPSYGDEEDEVFRGTTSLGFLNQDSDGPTTFVLADVNSWLKGTDGFDVTITIDGLVPGYWPTTIKSAKLVVWTDWTEPEPEPEPPVVPAPGALLLASLGAGLVSLLRTRKVV